MSCHNWWTFFNIRWFVSTQVQQECFSEEYCALLRGSTFFFTILVFLLVANKAHFSYGWFNMPIIHSPVDVKWSEKNGQIDWQWTTNSVRAYLLTRAKIEINFRKRNYDYSKICKCFSSLFGLLENTSIVLTSTSMDFKI